MFHIHRWSTVKTLEWATYYESYYAGPRVPAIEREGLPPVPTPTPPFMSIGERAVVGVALQECRCGARRSKHILESEFPPMDRWERKGGTR